MPARNPEAFQCFFCKHFSSKHCELLRHLATHGVDEKGLALSDEEKARFKRYNSHKPKAQENPEVQGIS